MTTGDPPEEGPLSAEDEQDIATLLGATSGPLVTPPEVVDRLDGVLADLVAASGTPATPATPAQWRPVGDDHRRRWPRVLLAAAAVVAGGYGVGQLVHSGTLAGGGGGTSSSTSGGAVDSKQLGSTGATQPRSEVLRGSPPVLHSGNLRADVRRILGDPSEVRALRAHPVAGLADCSSSSTLTSAYLVRLDGRRAALTLDGRGHGRVEALIYSCATGHTLARTTLPDGGR